MFASRHSSESMSRVAVVSLLFKAASFIYLRIIPTRLAQGVLPALFLSYLLCFAIENSRTPNNHNGSDRRSKSQTSPVGDIPTSSTVRVLSISGFRSIFLTHKTPTRALRLVAFFVNLLIFLCAVDFTLRPLYESNSELTFTRVGAIEPTQAKIVVRYPNMTDGLRIFYRQQQESSGEQPWLPGPHVELKQEHDWVGVARLTNLSPALPYEYRLAYINSSFLSHQSPLAFRTFPDPRVVSGSRFRFVVSSCIMPNFPYRPFGGNRIKGFDLLASFLSRTRSTLSSSSDISAGIQLNRAIQSNYSNSPVDFGILLGDFIYADVPVHVGDSAEAYTRLYRRNYASPSFRKVYEQLPIVNIYDDHEIINNFAGEDDEALSLYRNAMQPFQAYHAQANYDTIHKNQFYFDFRYGDTVFFVLDTRKYKTHGEGAYYDRTMIGKRQLRALHAWLGRVNTTATYKFIVSSVPFTTLWRGDAQIDSWAGFDKERNSLLETLSSIPNTFILSGDRHEFAAISHMGPHSGAVIELSTSPLSMFWIPLPRYWKIKQASKRVVHRHSVNASIWLPEEEILHYASIGNYKWTVIEVDTTHASKPKVSVELFVNSKMQWRHTFMGETVKGGSATAIGAHLSYFLNEVLEKVTLIHDPISKYLSG